MRTAVVRALLVVVAGLWLAGCNTTSLTSALETSSTPPGADAYAAAPASGDEPATDAITAAAPNAGLLGSEPYDDLALGKRHYRAENFGLAEKHFRRAVELHPRDAEAWLGLAATYDRLRRFDFADRAYAQAIGIIGKTPEVLNNQGFSYMLRGDYSKARATLIAARRKDPNNKFVANNLALLDEAARKGKAIQ